MTDQEFQLSTLQIGAIFSHIPSATKVFVSSSAQGYPARFVGNVARVLKMLKHEAQEEFPQLNVRDTSESSVTPMSIDGERSRAGAMIFQIDLDLKRGFRPQCSYEQAQTTFRTAP